MRPRLSLRGRSLLAAGVAAAVCGVVLGERDLVRLASLGVLLPLLAGVALQLTRGVRAEREISATRVPCGGEVEVRLRARSGTLPVFGLLVEERLPHALPLKGARNAENSSGRGTVIPGARFHIPRLGSRPVTLGYRLQPEIRGRHQIGPTCTHATDPFHLVDVPHVVGDTDHVLVLPQVAALPDMAGTSGPEPSASGSAGRRRGRGDDDMMVRPYRQGDDLRRVHWKSTARTGDLVVRQDEQPWLAGTTLVLDNRRHAHRARDHTVTGDSLEWAVSFVASLALRLRAAQQPARVRLADGHVLEGPREDELLDALALLPASSEHELALVEHDRSREAIFVLGTVTSSAVSEMIAGRAGSGSLPAPSSAVLLDTHSWIEPHPGENASGQHEQRRISPTVMTAAETFRAAGWAVTIAQPQLSMHAVAVRLRQEQLQRHTTGPAMAAFGGSS